MSNFEPSLALNFTKQSYSYVSEDVDIVEDPAGGAQGLQNWPYHLIYYLQVLRFTKKMSKFEPCLAINFKKMT